MNRFVNSFEFNNNIYYYYDLTKVFNEFPQLKSLPNSLKIVLESNIRNSSESDILKVIDSFYKKFNKEIDFTPNRVLFSATSILPILTQIVSAKQKLNNNIDISIATDVIINDNINSKREEEYYEFLFLAQNCFEKLTLVSTSDDLKNEINLEFLSTMLNVSKEDDKIFITPEILSGADSFSISSNALGVLGLELNGIDLESIMLGSSTSLDFPNSVGVEIKGSLAQGTGINDITLFLENLFKEHNIDGKIVEFFGDGIKDLTIEQRRVLSLVVEKYNGNCGYFPIDDITISFVEQTRGVDASLIKEYYKRQMLFNHKENLSFDETLILDLSLVNPIISTTKRVNDRISVKEIPSLINSYKKGNFINDNNIVLVVLENYLNSSNKTLFVQAALLAKKALELELSIDKKINCYFLLKSSFLKEYLETLNLFQYFEKLGFKFIKSFSEVSVHQTLELDIQKFNLNTSAILSTDKSNQKRVIKDIKNSWSMSPAMAISYTLNGSVDFDITKEAIYADIYLSDIWPSVTEVNEYLQKANTDFFQNNYRNVFKKEEFIHDTEKDFWNENQTFLSRIDLFENEFKEIDTIDIKDAKILAVLGDDISSSLIMPKGQIGSYTPSSQYLQSKGARPDEYDSFENRYANSEVIKRATLSSIELKNSMVSPKEGGYTKDFDTYEIMTISDFSTKMKKENRDLVIFAGKNFGSGIFNDISVKGLKLLGIKAIIAKTFDEDFKNYLIKVGILPLVFIDDDIDSLKLKGDEYISIFSNRVKSDDKIQLQILKANETRTIEVLSKISKANEVLYYRNSGLLPWTLKTFVNHSN